MSKTKMNNTFRNIWKETLIFLLCTCLNWFIAEYVILVPLNIHCVSLWIIVIINLLIGFVIFEISNYIDDSYGYEYKWEPIKNILSKVFLIASIVLVAVLIIGSIIGSKMFNASKYANLIEVENSSFEEDFDQVDINKLIIVDQKTAQKLGDRQLANFQNTSYYDVDDEYNLVKMGDEYLRISPVNYGSLFKAGKAGSIPGYVAVNSQNQESEAVNFTTAMIYSPSAFWSNDLSRHIHSKYPSYILGKHFFEMDEEGNPYWVTAVKEPSIFLFGGMLETKVLITNAVNGEITEYTAENVPEWVDHAHSVSYLMKLLGWQYSLRDGFLNSLFAKTNVFRTAYEYRTMKQEEDESKYTPFDGYNSVIGKDGNIYFYTGITPANSAETNVGFVLISPRTGKAYFYDSKGAEESSAQKAAEGLVSNLKYSASFPTIVNVNGEETYFMLLKDGAGLVQRYVFCNVENYSKVVEAATLNEALRKYNEKIGDQANAEIAESDTQGINRELKEISGMIASIEKAEIEGYTYYYFILDGDNKIFMSSITNSNLQPLMLKPGTRVKVTFYDADEGDVEIVTEISFK